MRVYNLSKTARDEIIEALSSLVGGRQIKAHELKMAESDDPEYVIVFDATQKLYLGRKKDSSSYIPLLKDELLLKDPPVVNVDSGAVKFVCNGANIMRPGVVRIDGDFMANDLVLVKEQKYGKPIAIGRAILPKSEMESATKGAVVTNLHFVGDKFWDMLKELGS